MIISVIFILAILLLLYLFFVPIDILIDSHNNQYWIKLRGLAKVTFEPHDQHIIRGKLTIFFRRFYFFPMSFNKPSKKNQVPNKRTYKIPIRKLYKLIKTFKVQKITMNVDSGDFIMNAYWVPFFAFLNHRYGGFNINNLGVNKIIVKLQNRPIYLIRTLFFNLKT